MWWNTIAVNEDPDKTDVFEERGIVSKDYITEEDVKFVAKISLGSDIEVINYHTKIFLDKKISFLCGNYQLNITIKRVGQDEPEIHSCFLKIIPYQIESQEATVVEGKFFGKETNFYRYVAPELLKDTPDKSFIAQCYLVKDNALVLENLTIKNGHTQSILSDKILLKSALTSLAKLHAATILAENRLGKTFIKLHPDIFEEWLFTKTGKMFKWFRSSVNVLVAVAKSLGLEDQHIPKICDHIFESFSSSKTRRNVVCHGDVKCSNLVFDDSRPMPNCTLVDFQVVRYVPAMADVSQLIYINCSKELRKNLEEDLLKHYYTAFSHALQEGNLKDEIPLYSDILQQYQELKLIGLVTNALYFPMQYIEDTKLEELTSDTDFFSKFDLENRVDLVLECMHQDTKYKNMLKEIICEINEKAVDFLQV